MSFCLPDKKQMLISSEKWVLLVKLENKLKLLKICKSDNSNRLLDPYNQHKLIYPYLKEDEVHCFYLPFLNISMLSTKYNNYDKLVSSLFDLTKFLSLINNEDEDEEDEYYNIFKNKYTYQNMRDLNNNGIKDDTSKCLNLDETMFIQKDEIPPSNNYDNVMEMKNFDNKFLDSNKQKYYLYLNKDSYKAHLIDFKLEMSYFPELKFVTDLELDLNLFTKYKEILSDYLFYDEKQLMSIVGSENLSFINLKDRFNLLFEKDSDNKITFDNILSNLILNTNDILNDKKILSFYKSCLKKILEINKIEGDGYGYSLKLNHSNYIISAKNLLKQNENNTEPIPVDVFNDKLQSLKDDLLASIQTYIKHKETKQDDVLKASNEETNQDINLKDNNEINQVDISQVNLDISKQTYDDKHQE